MKVLLNSIREGCLVFALCVLASVAEEGDGIIHLTNSTCVLASVAEEGDGIIHLTNPTLRLGIEKRGGHLMELRLADHDLNPLSWIKTKETMPTGAHKDAVYKGHFLCMGRTGMPSPGEMKAGVPMRGEQTGKVWTISSLSDRVVEMECTAPLDGLKVSRRVELDEKASCFFVTEEFENTGSLGRPNNILQHATIGPPFLSKATLINSNAKQGFFHKFEYPDPHRCEDNFPVVRLNESGDQTTDLRISSDPVNYLFRHIFDSSAVYGWATAYDPASGLVLGYVWKNRDYPWINFWQQVKEGKPVAKGLEFGTAGIGESYRRLLETDTRFHGVPSWEYIDAGETIVKYYLCFLIEIEKGAENPHMQVDGHRLILNGKIELPNPFVENNKSSKSCNTESGKNG